MHPPPPPPPPPRADHNRQRAEGVVQLYTIYICWSPIRTAWWRGKLVPLQMWMVYSLVCIPPPRLCSPHGISFYSLHQGFLYQDLHQIAHTHKYQSPNQPDFFFFFSVKIHELFPERIDESFGNRPVSAPKTAAHFNGFLPDLYLIPPPSFIVIFLFFLCKPTNKETKTNKFWYIYIYI